MKTQFVLSIVNMLLVKLRESSWCDIQLLAISIRNDKIISDILQDKLLESTFKSFIGYLLSASGCLSIFFMCDIIKISTICRKISLFSTHCGIKVWNLKWNKISR